MNVIKIGRFLHRSLDFARWWAGDRSRPKVFGIGLNKTGTTTLGHCLELLGYRHLGHSRDLLEQYRAGNVDAVLAATEHFSAFEDWPWPLLFRELYGRYGDGARYILTTRRSPEAWLDSLKAHSLRTNPNVHWRSLAYGYEYPHGYEAEHIAIYEAHNAAVREFFSPRSAVFLDVCWETGDGWNELCSFLGHRVPTTPFPHANRGSECPMAEAVRNENARRIALQLASKPSRP